MSNSVKVFGLNDVCVNCKYFYEKDNLTHRNNTFCKKGYELNNSPDLTFCDEYEQIDNGEI